MSKGKLMLMILGVSAIKMLSVLSKRGTSKSLKSIEKIKVPTVVDSK